MVVSGNQAQDVWFELPVRCHSATATGQPHPPCSTYRGLWRACGYLVVCSSVQSTGGSSQWCPGFDSRQVSSPSSIFASEYVHDYYFFMHVVCFIKEIFTSSVRQDFFIFVLQSSHSSTIHCIFLCSTHTHTHTHTQFPWILM